MKRFSITVLLLAMAAFTGASTPPASQGSAPATFRVLLDTSKGPVVIVVDRHLAPHGAQRFYELIKAKYFDGARFYPAWCRTSSCSGVRQQIQRSTKSGTKHSRRSAQSVEHPGDGNKNMPATSVPNSRSTHMFINLGNNARLDGMGFARIGHLSSRAECRTSTTSTPVTGKCRTKI